MTNGLERLIARVRAGLQARTYPNESAVSTSIVLPVLRALGWDDTDPLEVRPEYRNARGKVDFALFGRLGSPAVFIEVKAVGAGIDGDRQLFEYAFHDGAQIAVLTDGHGWNIYLPGQMGSYEERRVYQVDLVERAAGDVAAALVRYLARDRVCDGRALEDALADYRARTSSRLAEQTIPLAWADLCDEPDPALVTLLADRVEAMCGLRPDSARLVAFLANRPANDAASISPRSPPAARPPRPGRLSAPPQQAVVTAPVTAPPAHRVRWRLFERSGTSRTAVDSYQQFFAALFERYEDRRAEIASAVATRKRPKIASRPEAVYPSAELSLKNNRPLSGGWFIGTNESDGTKLQAIKAATCRLGLVDGRDYEFVIDKPDNG